MSTTPSEPVHDRGVAPSGLDVDPDAPGPSRTEPDTRDLDVDARSGSRTEPTDPVLNPELLS